MLTGATVTLDVDLLRDRIADIQDRLHTFHSIKPENQLLTFCGKVLQSDKLLSDYNIDPFCTLDLSLRLMSSKASPLTIHLPSSITLKDHSTTIPLNPGQSLLDLKRQITDVTQQKHTFKWFVHSGNRYEINDDVTVNNIAHIWTDNQLHVSNTPSFFEAQSVRLTLLFEKNLVCTIRVADDFSAEMSITPLDVMIRSALKKRKGVHNNRAFIHPECPFKSVKVQYNGVNVRLRMKSASKVAVPLKDETPIEMDYVATEFDFGTLPEMTLADIKQYFPNCDCCRSKLKPISKHSNILITERTVHQVEEDDLLVIVELCENPFLFEDQYYSNGYFHPRSRRRDILTVNSPVTDSRLFPIMPHPQCLSEELLVHGFMRRYYCWVPMELRMLISCFFPKLYAGRYDVKQHNVTLDNELTQKTKTFEIQDIVMTLHYGSERESVAHSHRDQSRYFMTLDLTKSNAVELVLCVSTQCTVTNQSDTRIHRIAAVRLVPGMHTSVVIPIQLPDIGDKTSLSSLVCDLQIVRMSTSDDTNAWEYPLKMRRNAYLMEWTISSEMVDRFKQSVSSNVSQQSYESRVFYDMLSERTTDQLLSRQYGSPLSVMICRQV